MRKSVVPINPHHAVPQCSALGRVELVCPVQVLGLWILSMDGLTWETAYGGEEEEELYGWEYGEDSALSSLFILPISCFRKCPHSEGPKGGGWMWSCWIPTGSMQQPGAEDGHPWYLPQTPECCGAGDEQTCWELAGFSSLNSSFLDLFTLVHPHAI